MGWKSYLPLACFYCGEVPLIPGRIYDKTSCTRCWDILHAIGLREFQKEVRNVWGRRGGH